MHPPGFSMRDAFCLAALPWDRGDRCCRCIPSPKTRSSCQLGSGGSWVLCRILVWVLGVLNASPHSCLGSGGLECAPLHSCLGSGDLERSHTFSSTRHAFCLAVLPWDRGDRRCRCIPSPKTRSLYQYWPCHRCPLSG